MLLYADEDFPHPAVEELKLLGHDIVTAQEDGHSALSDDVLLARSHFLGRVILTHNRRHYERMHRAGAEHSGIVSATRDADYAALASRINATLIGKSPGNWFIHVKRLP